MAMQTVSLKVDKRESGKANSRGLRVSELVPAVIYGAKVKNQNLTVGEFLVKKYSGHGQENTIFKLESDVKDLNGLSVLMKKVDVHPLTRRPQHVDFYAIDMTATLRLNVEFRFEGKSKGVSESGGIFQTLMRTVEIECLPTDIPEYIAVDVSNLDINDTLHVSDLVVPKGVKITAQGDLAIANVTVPQAEEVAAPVAVAADAAAAPGAAGAAAAPGAAGAAAPAKEGDKAAAKPAKKEKE